MRTILLAPAVAALALGACQPRNAPVVDAAADPETQVSESTPDGMKAMGAEPIAKAEPEGPAAMSLKDLSSAPSH